METKNIIILLVFVLGLGGVGAFFLLTDTFPDGDDNYMPEPPNPSNETYKRLSKSITEIEVVKKWNKNSYALAKSDIGDALKNELISEKQASALQERLEGVYLIILADTVVNFCELGTDIAIINELAQEVEKFKDKPTKIATARENITNYRAAINSCNTAFSAVKGAYKKGYNDSLIKSMRINTTKNHIVINKYIQKLDSQCIVVLSEHKDLGENVERIIKEVDDELLYKNRILSRICSNSKYKPMTTKYSYYKNICECISSSNNCDSTKIIQAHLPQN
jgi:hypothetical protein